MQLFKGPATCTPVLMQRLWADLGNLRSLVLYSLGSEAAEIQTFECVIDLASFTYATRLGSLEGLDGLEERMEALDDLRLLGRYLHIMVLYNHQKLEQNTRKAIACFEKAGAGSKGELAKSHRALAFCHLLWQQNSVAIVQELTTAISIAAEANTQHEEACAHVKLQAHYCTIQTLSSIQYTRVGNITLALKHAPSRQGQLLARAAGNIWTEASALRAQASVCGRLGDYARGVQLCAAAKKLLRALGMDNIHVTVFRNVLNTEAAIFQYQTDYAAAREINALLAPSAEEMQTQRGWSHLEISNGYALLKIASIDIATADGEDDLMTLGYLQHARGDFDGGLQSSLDMFRTMTDVDQRMILLQRIIDDAVDRKRPANFQQKKLFALRRMADVFVAEDKDDESALAVYQMALGAFTAMEVAECKLPRRGCWH
ncbi:hypothetical protein C8F01DRAFT_1155654 [Mycena amicta]|nr:hypothetical protein C8F01DRAFT_1155654 [Mycena amicta]